MSRSFSRRDFLQSAAATAIGSSSWAWLGCVLTRDYDVLIRGGLIIDGTGRDGEAADLGIRNGRIVAMGNLAQKSARRVIQAQGMVVCPGFIDIHSHSDDDLLIDPRAESKIRQGVTTEVLGQDGESLAPLTEAMRAEMDARWRDKYGTAVDWTDFAGYFRRLEARRMAVNVISMVGQGTLRAYVIGEANQPAAAEDLAGMQALARQAFQQGAFGISSGLEYTPGSFATTAEITDLCRAMDGRGLYSTHMRNEGDAVLEAIDEAIAIANGSGVALNISHLKAEGRRNWHKAGDILQRLATARQAGLRVTCDRYPYVAYNTELTSLFPLWSRDGGREKFVERLRDPALRDSLSAAVAAKITMLGSWEAAMISSMDKEAHKRFEGQTIAAAAQQQGQEPFAFLMELMIEEEGRGDMVGFAMSEEEISKILADPFCMVASDASAKAVDGPLREGNPHPRAFGSFPRTLGKYAREDHLFSLPEAIRKCTSLPASTLGLPDRGVLREGSWADVVVFDAGKVHDRATWQAPWQYPEGLPFVLVNGEVVVDGGEHTQQLPGRVLRAPFAA